jgi:hypothetical protein
MFFVEVYIYFLVALDNLFLFWYIDKKGLADFVEAMMRKIY